jgi:hypothetical protein
MADTEQEPFATLVIPAPNGTLITTAKAALDRLRAMKIVTEDDYKRAGLLHREIKAIHKAVDEHRTSMKRPVDQIAAEIQNYHRAPLEFCDEAETLVERMMATWLREQETERKRLQAIADQQADAERQRLQKLAERAAGKGDHMKAERLETQAATVVPPRIVSAAPKVAGQSVRATYKFEIENPALLPREYLCADEKKIRAYVNAMRAEARIPGVRIYQDTSIVSRGV